MFLFFASLGYCNLHKIVLRAYKRWQKTLTCTQMCGRHLTSDTNKRSHLHFGGRTWFVGLMPQEIAETSATDCSDEAANQSAESKRQARCFSPSWPAFVFKACIAIGSICFGCQSVLVVSAAIGLLCVSVSVSVFLCVCACVSVYLCFCFPGCG